MDYKLISTYLDYCKTHKRLSSHTIRAYKNDLMQFYNSDYDNVESYIEQLTQLSRKILILELYFLLVQNLFLFLNVIIVLSSKKSML